MSKKTKPQPRSSARAAVLRELRRGDGDSIGSEMALGASLRAAGKKVTVVKADHCPPRYDYLRRAWMKENIPGDKRLKADCVVVLDCPEIKRIGKHLFDALPPPGEARWVSIDHHLGHAGFGHLNWVNERASSVGEMIYELITAGKLPLPDLTRDALYTAMVTDTGQFSFSNTSSSTLRAAADLIDRGCNSAKIMSYINESKTDPEMALERMAYNSLKIQGPVAWIALSAADFKKAKAGVEHIQEIISIARSVRTVQAAALFCEKPGTDKVSVSLRGKNGFDVRAVAMKFGGGGHKLAAGCMIDMDLAKAQRIVLAEIRKRLKAQRRT